MIDQLKKINILLNKHQKTSLLFLTFLIFIGLLLEILSLGSIVPLIDVVFNQNDESDNLFVIKWFHSFFLNKINFSQFVILLVLFIFSIKTLYFFILTVKQNTFLANLNSSVGNNLFIKYLSNNYSFFNSTNNSVLVKNLQVEVNYFNAYCQNLLIIFVELFLTISILSTLLYIKPYYTLILGLLLIFIILFIVLFTKKRTTFYGLNREVLDRKLAKISTDTFGSIKTIILMNKINFFSKIYLELNNQRAKFVSKQNTLTNLPRYFIEFTVILGLLTFLFVIKNYTENSLSILSTMGLFITALFRLMPSINKILASYQSLKFYDSSIDVIYKEMNNILKPNFLGNQTIKSPNDSIIINELSFSHDDKIIFDNLQIVFKINDSVGIVGASGSGKSTFSELFMGLLTPTTGNIYFKGKSIFSNLSSWQSNIGYVPQFTYLIDDSLKRNIAFGIPDSEINVERLNDVLNYSGLDEFLRKLDNGLDHIVGENGSSLSGGEIQRIGLARALYNNPKVLILDEPTSALDKVMSNKIMETISTLIGKLTIILITHDLELLNQFNKIYKIEDNVFQIIKDN
jgi:ATP-binding cassette, subfamily B, bacterial PglK